MREISGVLFFKVVMAPFSKVVMAPLFSKVVMAPLFSKVVMAPLRKATRELLSRARKSLFRNLGYFLSFVRDGAGFFGGGAGYGVANIS